MENVSVQLPPDDLLREQAYIVARGVRPLSLVGQLHTEGGGHSMLLIATQLERHCQACVIPFVVHHADGVASFGFAESRWALDEWAVRDPAVPEEQRHQIIGLLLGYGAPAVARYEDKGSGRRFTTA